MNLIGPEAANNSAAMLQNAPFKEMWRCILIHSPAIISDNASTSQVKDSLISKTNSHSAQNSKLFSNAALNIDRISFIDKSLSISQLVHLKC